jgi:hypothetical protein
MLLLHFGSCYNFVIDNDVAVATVVVGAVAVVEEEVCGNFLGVSFSFVRMLASPLSEHIPSKKDF